MDFTDVHDESNRWIKLDGIESPVLLDQKAQKEIKKIFNFKNNFKMTRILTYNLNSFLRNIRKEFNKEKFEKADQIIGKTFWGSFTHIPYNELDKQFWSKNDFKYGINSIMKNVKDISRISKINNSEFYI